jgi:hypothetical protein
VHRTSGFLPSFLDAVSRPALLASVLLGVSACASGPDPSAFKNRVFYEYGSGQLTAKEIEEFERPYQPLDARAEARGSSDYIGVQVLKGAVRLSRPRDWIIRSASLEPERRFIEYVSPRQIAFAVYERIESPLDPWREIMQRYEEDVQKEGGTLLGKAVPAATWNAQARAYDVQRAVPAPKAPFLNRCREYLVRSEHRLLLVQIVYQGETIEPFTEELLRVIDTLQVL